jgi:hypothetical protein
MVRSMSISSITFAGRNLFGRPMNARTPMEWFHRTVPTLLHSFVLDLSDTVLLCLSELCDLALTGVGGSSETQIMVLPHSSGVYSSAPNDPATTGLSADERSPPDILPLPAVFLALPTGYPANTPLGAHF